MRLFLQRILIVFIGGVFLVVMVSAQDGKYFNSKLTRKDLSKNEINGNTYENIQPKTFGIIKDLKAEDTFSVGYSKFLFAGLFGGGYPPVGLTGGYLPQYYNPYLLGGLGGHGGGGYFGHNHFHHGYHHHHHGGFYPQFGFHGHGGFHF